MDWSREQFTMDPHFTRAVIKVFVDLYRDRLIYRDKRLVNWDPKLGTAISDLEVETREVEGHFWHIRYPLADGARTADGTDHIIVATTRPETMLADMAVAVHPDDARYAALVAGGAKVTLPITGRTVPIIADEHADPALGSGAVKITPGHDFNDFEVARRAGIAAADMINILDAQARITRSPLAGLYFDRAEHAVPVKAQQHANDPSYASWLPERYDGLTREEARELVLEDLDKIAAVALVEPRVIQVPVGDRSGVVIEPWLTDQWYVDAGTLARPAIEAVRSGAVKIVPASWEKTFFHWMDNIQPWCISRQLWWGHRVPVWYAPDGRFFIAETEAEAQAQAGNGVALAQDEDVLDTWFSSALWPFATLGWPDEDAPLLDRHYPTDVLISGFDILFFWDARMLMQGIKFRHEAPWRTLYLHGLVRAPDGQKMSKSKGNVVDPLGLIDQYGADALRFFMAAMESQGRDIKMDEPRLAGYRNFATKLWNAARFCEANGIGASTSIDPPAATHAVNRWIIAQIGQTRLRIDAALASLRFDDAANAIYPGIWAGFGDWYLELIKGAIDDETRAVAGWALDQLLVMLHPFMPFITEALWQARGPRDNALIVSAWPSVGEVGHADAVAQIDEIIALVGAIRAARAEVAIAPGVKLPLYGSPAAITRLSPVGETLQRMARLDGLSADDAPDGPALRVAVAGDEYVLPIGGTVDVGAERERLVKALAEADRESASLGARLGNAAFLDRAKPDAVAKARADHARWTAERDRLATALDRLG